MGQHQENVRRQAFAYWVEKKAGGKTMLEITLTMHQAIPKAWLRHFAAMRVLPNDTRRAFKVGAIRSEIDGNGCWTALTQAIVELNWKQQKAPLRALTRAVAHIELQQLVNRLLKQLGRAWRHGEKELQRAFCIEGDGDVQRFHIHGLVEVPDGYSTEEFAKLIGWCWEANSLWAQERKEIKQADSIVAFAYYMTKYGLDSLSWKTLHI